MTITSLRCVLLVIYTCLATLHAAPPSDLATLKQTAQLSAETASANDQDPQGRRLFPSTSTDDDPNSSFKFSNIPRNEPFLTEEVQYAPESSRQVLSVTSGGSRHEEELDPYSLVPEDFHQFLDIPIHKYKNGTEVRTHQRHRTPLVSGGYANTQVQGFGNNKRVQSQKKRVTHRPVSYGYQLATASPQKLDYGQRKQQNAWLNKKQSATKPTTAIPTFTTTETLPTTTTTTPTTTTTTEPSTTRLLLLPLQENHVDQLNLQWKRQQDFTRTREEYSNDIVTEPARVVTAGQEADFGRKKIIARTTEQSVAIEPQTTEYTAEDVPQTLNQWPVKTEVSSASSKNRNRPTLYETLALGRRPGNRRRPFLPSDRVQGNKIKRPFTNIKTITKQSKPLQPSLLSRFPPIVKTTKQPTVRTTEKPQPVSQIPQLNEIVPNPVTVNRKKPSLSAFLSGAVNRETTTEKFGFLEQFPTFENQFSQVDKQRQRVRPALETWEEKQQKLSNSLPESIERKQVDESNKVNPENQYGFDKGQFSFNPNEAESFHLNEQFHPEQHQFSEVAQTLFQDPAIISDQKAPAVQKTEPLVNFGENSQLNEEFDFGLPPKSNEDIRKETDQALSNHPLNLRPPIPGRIAEQRPIVRRPLPPTTSAPSYLNSFLSWFRNDARPTRPLPPPAPQRPQNIPVRFGPGRPWQSFGRPPPQFQRQVPGSTVPENLKPPVAIEQGQTEYISQISAKVGTLPDAKVGTEITQEDKLKLPNILPRFRPNINEQRVRAPPVQRRRGHPGQVHTSQMKHGALSLPSVPQLMRAPNNNRPNTFIAAGRRPMQHRPHLAAGPSRIAPDQLAVRRAERPALSTFTPMNAPPPRPSQSQPPLEYYSSRQDGDSRAALLDDLIASESHQEATLTKMSRPHTTHQNRDYNQQQEQGEVAFDGNDKAKDSSSGAQMNEGIQKQEMNEEKSLMSGELEETMKSSGSHLGLKPSIASHPTILSVPASDDSLLANVGATSSYRIAPANDREFDTANPDVLILGSVESEPLVHSHHQQDSIVPAKGDRQKRSVKPTAVLHRQDQLEFIPVPEST